MMARIFTRLHWTSAFRIAAGASSRAGQRPSSTEKAADSLMKITMSRAWICSLKSESAARNQPSDRASRDLGDPIFSPQSGWSIALRSWAFAAETSSEVNSRMAPERCPTHRASRSASEWFHLSS